MSQISQRTVVELEAALWRLVHWRLSRDSVPLVPPKKLWRELYALDFGRHLLDFLSAQYKWDFSRLLPSLHDGEATAMFHGRVDEEGEVHTSGADVQEGRLILTRLAEYVIARAAPIGWHLPEIKESAARLKASIELDGFRFLGEKLVAADVANLPEQVSELQQLLREADLAHFETSLHHYTNAEDAYVQQKWDTATGEWRKFYESVLRDIASTAAAHRPDLGKNPADLPKYDMKSVFHFLRSAEFLNDDEMTAVGGVWGFLSCGNHPGIGERHIAQFAMTLALTFGQVLLGKLLAWKRGNFNSFVT